MRTAAAVFLWCVVDFSVALYPEYVFPKPLIEAGNVALWLCFIQDVLEIVFYMIETVKRGSK